MSRATPMMRDFAERLIAYESRGKKPAGAKTPAAFEVCEKLRPHLATFMGKAGFQALLSRALALASAEVPRLSAVQVRADDTLAGLDEEEAPAERAKLIEGGIVLLAHLLALLEAFIGENLMLRMLCAVWPKLTLSHLYFENDDQK